MSNEKKNRKKVIEILNGVLTAELTAINQYFVHSEMAENWGYERLHKTIRHHSIGEMKHAEEVIERILYLEGVPNVQRLFTVRIGENAELGLHDSHRRLATSSSVFRAISDSGSPRRRQALRRR